MLWSEAQAGYLAAVDSVTAVIPKITDFTAPGLGVWDVMGLTGHLLRAIRTPLTYLAEPEPSGEPLPDAAAYYERYLRRRADGPATVDRAVADRGSEELAALTPAEVAPAFENAASALRSVLPATPAERRLPSPMGVMRIQDYLRTRNLEVVVHGVDLSRATGVPWQPPDEPLQDTLTLLTEVALRRGRATDLLMVLTGRQADTPPLPILQ